MQVSQFPCPHCSTNLRIRDRGLIGKQIDCPDCSRPMRIVADGPKRLAAEWGEDGDAAESTPKSGTRKRRKSKSRKPDGGRRKKMAAEVRPPVSVGRRALKVFKNPVVVSWIVAVVATGTIVGVVLSRAAERDVEQSAFQTATKTEEVPHGKSAKADNRRQMPIDPWNVDAKPTRQRLESIARLLKDFERRRGRFPHGTVLGGGIGPEQRLSWIARLAANSKRYGTRQPDWNRPWRDAVNEPFARQQLDLFRNPQLPGQPGPDGLPVTHFVGVAGVGADGPLLPADHPRAGIFAYNRATKRADIRDGLGNTMLLAGVHKHVGGWAAGGRPTIRPFVKEPYVHGPDGFGTGHGKGMLVLMADGSVRTVTRKTPPVIVRRMAAMADGFPLDPKVPGDPLKSRVQPPPIVRKKRRVKPPVVAAKPNRTRIDVNRINVTAALSQKVLRFENPGKATRRMLIAEVEELAGVPIRVDSKLKPALSALLDQRVPVKLENATARDVLLAILKKTGLTFAIEKRGVRIIPAQP